MNIGCIVPQTYHETSKNIEAMGDLLKNINNTAMNLDNKLTKMAVTAQVTGLGNNIDVSA